MAKMKYIALLFATLLSLNSCHNEVKMNRSLPYCRNFADLNRLHGQRVIVEGIYEQEPFPGSKRLQAALIILSDGTELIRSYRPVPEEFGFINKRIEAVGTVFLDAGQPPEVQQVMSPHFRPEEISLAPGEPPYPVPPREIPTPPLVETRNDLHPLLGRWVCIYGVLQDLRPMKGESFWGQAVLRLSDGTTLFLNQIPLSYFDKQVGKDITVIGKFFLERESLGVITLNSGRVTVCPGRNPRCGM